MSSGVSSWQRNNSVTYRLDRVHEEKTELINQTVTCHIDLILKDYRKGVCSDEKTCRDRTGGVVLAAVVAGGYWWYQSRQDTA